eukprot:gnl/Spiro4/13203_TR7002_c0_g2_i1.p1 gnl/Spiro4/13203_TR7002_c0_g2~~gnl/Spiro4/13203_TR7002_c0_g2_i1.p1  ORF type:complete len:224 (-),score=44.23 gnl/Spiro4/13203_TR7002_c0_g2_i1:3-674(-)
MSLQPKPPPPTIPPLRVSVSSLKPGGPATPSALSPHPPRSSRALSSKVPTRKDTDIIAKLTKRLNTPSPGLDEPAEGVPMIRNVDGSPISPALAKFMQEERDRQGVGEVSWDVQCMQDLATRYVKLKHKQAMCNWWIFNLLVWHLRFRKYLLRHTKSDRHLFIYQKKQALFSRYVEKWLELRGQLRDLRNSNMQMLRGYLTHYAAHRRPLTLAMSPFLPCTLR